MPQNHSLTSESPDGANPSGCQQADVVEQEDEFKDDSSLSAQDSNPHPPTPNSPWFAYVVPVVVFSFISWLESRVPNHYVAIYVAKALIVTIALIILRSAARDYASNQKALIPGMLVGFAIFVEWVLIEKYVPYPHVGSRVGFNPFAALQDSGERALFLITRFYGLVLMVPFMEELFWRSFLLRFLTDSKWQALPLDRFSWGAFGFVAVGFAAAHPEWLPAAICGAAYALLLRQTGSLIACFMAHAVTNLCLGIYIITTGTWNLW